jgi:hypothetical protein
MASACFSVKSMERGTNHKAHGKPMDRTPPISIRDERNAGAEPSSCFAAPKKSPLLTLAFGARRTQGLESLTAGQSFLRARYPEVGLRRNKIRQDEYMPFVKRSIESTSRSLARNATLVVQMSRQASGWILPWGHQNSHSHDAQCPST